MERYRIVMTNELKSNTPILLINYIYFYPNFQRVTSKRSFAESVQSLEHFFFNFD